MAGSETLDRLWNCATGDAARIGFPYQRCLALESWPDLLKIPIGLGMTAGVAAAWMHKRLEEDFRTPRRLVSLIERGDKAFAAGRTRNRLRMGSAH